MLLFYTQHVIFGYLYGNTKKEEKKRKRFADLFFSKKIDFKQRSEISYNTPILLFSVTRVSSKSVLPFSLIKNVWRYGYRP
jgi:hypothetical protein